MVKSRFQFDLKWDIFIVAQNRFVIFESIIFLNLQFNHYKGRVNSRKIVKVDNARILSLTMVLDCIAICQNNLLLDNLFVIKKMDNIISIYVIKVDIVIMFLIEVSKFDVAGDSNIFS
jgi:hypothetical protein